MCTTSLSLVEDYSTYENSSVKISAVRYFHFSRYKSMETLSCHSNETTWSTAIKNKRFVEPIVMNISAKFQLHPPYVFWGDDFWIFFRECILLVAMATNQFSSLDTIHMFGRGLLKEHLRKTFVKISCNETAIKVFFHFSHYKSMETLNCHSNESTWATAIKNITFVEANVMNMFAKFQLHPTYGFWGDDFLIFFRNLSFRLPWQPIKFSGLHKIHMFGRGLLKEHSVKFF